MVCTHKGFNILGARMTNSDCSMFSSEQRGNWRTLLATISVFVCIHACSFLQISFTTMSLLPTTTALFPAIATPVFIAMLHSNSFNDEQQTLPVERNK